MKKFVCFALLSFSSFAVGGETQVVDLKCDYRVTPLAVERSDPYLSWRLEGVRQGLAQQAYQIQAATSLALLESPDLWDSGWVENKHSTTIAYAGSAFGAKQRVYWRVRIEDEAGYTLDWSEPSWFEGGLLQDADWNGAAWISCTREFGEDYAPADVMGDWVAANEDGTEADSIVYSLSFSLPDKYVVYAGAWWNYASKGESVLDLNGYKGLSGPEGPATIHYKEYSFFMKKENKVSITLKGADLATPISFGMRVVFADGTERLIQSSAEWTVRMGDEQMATRVVGAYGEAPFGKAKIAPRAPLAAAWYKKDFEVKKEVESARLYVCGLGYNEPYLNGEKVGDHVLDPAQTDYPEFAHYQAFDVADQLKAGGNAIAILLGDGWYNNDRMFSHARFAYGKPGLRAYLDIRYADGTRESVLTDETWRWKASEVLMSSIFMGDRVDYREGQDEWMAPGVPDAWEATREVAPLSPKLVAQDLPPIRVVDEIDPVKTWQIGEKTWIVDLGQNISGWIGLEFDEPSGVAIRIRMSEMLDESGRYLDNVPFSFWNCHATPQAHEIIADGKPRSWRPRFSYQGFRFAEISGLSKVPRSGQIKGLVVHTEAPVTARFDSSNPLLNRIFKMGIQTHQNNMHSILEDCPQREKCLWGGDLHSSWATGFYTLDSAAFYRQQARVFFTPPFDPIGIPGRIGVGKRSTNKTLDFTWSVSPLFVAWQNFQLNGDLQTARDFYGEMRDLLRVTEENSTDLLPNIHRYGDHAPPVGVAREPADSQLIAALNFYAAAKRFADFATALGKEDDALWSRDLAKRIGKSIIKRYYDEEQKTFGNGTHDSLALAFGLLDPSEAKGVGASLVETYEKNGKQFDGGFMSYYIYPKLTEFGHVDLALEMLLNPDYPGIAQSIRDYDATTIFEQFRNDGRARQLGKSLNHHAMNHPTAWMLNYLAGIRAHPDETGFRRILLQPYFPAGLDWVEAEKRTDYGMIRSAWKREGGMLVWSFTVPPNSIAEVRLPQYSHLGEPTKMKGASSVDGAVEFSAGTYQLEWKL